MYSFVFSVPEIQGEGGTGVPSDWGGSPVGSRPHFCPAESLCAEWKPPGIQQQRNSSPSLRTLPAATKEEDTTAAAVSVTTSHPPATSSCCFFFFVMFHHGTPAPQTCIDRFLARVEVSAASRYTQASIVYLLYVSIILFINLSLSPAADAAYNDDVYIDD